MRRTARRTDQLGAKWTIVDKLEVAHDEARDHDLDRPMFQRVKQISYGACQDRQIIFWLERAGSPRDS